jgi:hypothetical protein
VKYKNKNGIELNYMGNDTHQKLVKEVISESIRILSTYDRNCKISMNMAMSNCKKFLKENFDLVEKNKGYVHNTEEQLDLFDRGV